MCVGRCGVYIENQGPVLILSGVGLDVEDADHNQLFMMQVGLFFHNVMIGIASRMLKYKT